MEPVFTYIYENSIWANNNNTEYKGSSGPGSSIELNINTYVPFLKKFITDNNIKTIIDLGCGDFRCGPVIYNDMNISYTGYDAYKKVIEYNAKNNSLPKYNFIHLDFCNKKEDIKTGDLCILKDVLQHWSLDNIYSFLDYMVENKKFKYILIVNCCNQLQDNTDIMTGCWRQLNCNLLPLKKYNPVEVYKYDTKQVSIIKLS
jgi:hypothetical protein